MAEVVVFYISYYEGIVSENILSLLWWIQEYDPGEETLDDYSGKAIHHVFRT